MKALFQFLLIVLTCFSIYTIDQLQAQKNENGQLLVSNQELSEKIKANPMVDYPVFKELTNEVQKFRQKRLIPIQTFLKYKEEENTVILDTRSRAAFQKRHIKGAINLPFSDFTSTSLKQLIPNEEARILIYCNNNFSGDFESMVSKLPPLALNIPTFINLYGYGYKNVFELKGYTDVNDPLVSDHFQIDSLTNLSALLAKMNPMVKPSHKEGILANGKCGISGKVTEEATGSPVLFAAIALYMDNKLVKGTDTDFDGNFNFSDLSPGLYDLEVSYIGLETQRIKNLELEAGKLHVQNVKMKESANILDEVHIVGYKVPLMEFDNTTSGSVVYSKEISGKPHRSSKRRHKKKWNKDRKNVAQSVSSGEDYKKPGENKFISPISEAVSTFSLDVDRASYSNLRRMINNNQVPPKEAIRVEEMINYFDYGYEHANEEHPLSLKATYTSCPWNSDHQLLHLGFKASEISKKELPSSNLVFLVDVSGSMISANKLPLLKESFKLLLGQLKDDDRVAIVTYAGSAGVPLPSTPVRDKNKILECLVNLRSGGGTAGAQGIISAYEIAQANFIEGGNNRVILATDGDFNIGVSSTQDLEKLISEKKESGVFLSILGFGMGNYKDHKMQTLANKGNGNHAYIDDIVEAKKIFIKEYGGTLFTVAKDVKVQIEFNPAYVHSYRLVGYENRMLAKEDFDDDTKDAGEVGSGHEVTAIYELIPVNSKSEFKPKLTKKEKKKSRSIKQAQQNGKIAYLKCRYKHPNKSKSIKFDQPVSSSLSELKNLGPNIKFSLAVAHAGQILAKSKYVKDLDLSNAINLANTNRIIDQNGYKAEFVNMMESYQKYISLAKAN